MNKFYVYSHISPSGKKYVGISCDPHKRWSSGKGYSKNYHFYRAIQKYGWNSFQHVIIAKNLSAEEAKAMEIQLIAKWNLTDPAFGYNLREGGDGSFSQHSRDLMSAARIGNQNCVGNHPTDEVRQKISFSLREYYQTHDSPMQGRHHNVDTIRKLKEREISDETRRKMSTNHADVSGDKNPSARPIRQLSSDGKLIKEFAYATEAAKEYGLDLSSIIKCCKKKAKTCGGYRWEYL